MQGKNVFIHDRAEVQTGDIGEGTAVWQCSVILKGARIGRNCNINCHTFIENDVIIGDNVTVKAGVYLWDGIRVENNVFIGPNVSFTNDKYPRSKKYPDTFQTTVLREGSSIGAGAIVLGGVTVGAYAVVGSGSLVSRDVPDFALVMGSPARIAGWVDKEGQKLTETGNGFWAGKDGSRFEVINNELKRR